jgi:hypothetical protein
MPGISSTPVRAALGVDAFFSQAEPLHWLASEKVFLNNRRRILRLDMAIPNGFWINDDCGPMFTLVKTARLVDSNLAAQTCCL